MISSNIYFDQGRSFVSANQGIETLRLALGNSKGPFILSSILAIPSSKHPQFGKKENASKNASTAILTTRKVYWRNLGAAETKIYDMEKLRNGNVVEGPAIIQSEDTTIVLEPEFEYIIDEYENGVIKKLK